MNPFLALRILKLGVKSLLLHKLRSLLNMLGILFGVGSVIAMLAIGEGAAWEAQQLVKKLGPTTIILYSQKPSEEDQSATTTSRMIVYGLSFEDLDRIGHTLPSVKIVVPVRKAVKEVWKEGRRTDLTLLGTIPKYTDVTPTKLKSGRWLNQLDYRDKRPVAVLKEEAARALFPAQSPLDRVIRVGDTAFRIVGVLGPMGMGSGKGRSSADVPMGAFVPLSAMRERFGDINAQRSSGSFSIEQVDVHEAEVKVADIPDVLPVARNVRALLEKAHPKKDYSVFVPLEQLRLAERQAAIWTIVLACVAGISLLVGGIGIMNVMLATVTERTREIGIRRALGATKKHIMSQFLVETLVLTLAGGVLGIGFGLGLPPLVNLFAQVKTHTPLYALLLAPGISLLVGLLSGLYPAWKAAGMDPVEALRHE